MAEADGGYATGVGGVAVAAMNGGTMYMPIVFAELPAVAQRMVAGVDMAAEADGKPQNRL